MNDLRLAFLQTHIDWQNPERNRQHIAQQLERARQSYGECDLWVLPEVFTTGFAPSPNRPYGPKQAIAEAIDGPTTQWMQAQAAIHQAVITGSVTIDDNGKRFNRLLWVQPDGQYYYYDKRHLFRMGGEHKRYSMGDKPLLIEWKGWRFSPQVCYDLRFPAWCRNRAEHQQPESRMVYDVQLFVANWPESRRHHWRTLLQARAIENLSYCVGVNRVGQDANGLQYSGDSMVVSPEGSLLCDAKAEEGAFYSTLSWQQLCDYRQRFPAFLDADTFIIND